MSDLLIDEVTGDIDITNGELTLTDDKRQFVVGVNSMQATMQRLRQKLRFFFAEWFLDKSKGVPYLEQILLKNPNPSMVEAIYVSQISDDKAVREIEELNLNVENRNLSLEFRARCDDGVINFSDSGV